MKEHAGSMSHPVDLVDSVRFLGEETGAAMARNALLRGEVPACRG